MATLTIFANFRINDEERLWRMKDSFRSFKDIDAEKWVINVRGKYRVEALSFLRQDLGTRLVSYDIETNRGWFHDTRQMLGVIQTDYVFLWVEDHINQVATATYSEILDEMKRDGVEFMWYSWWLLGKLPAMYSGIEKTKRVHISTFVLNEAVLKKIQPDPWFPYHIIMQGFFSADLFKKVITSYSPFLRWHYKMTPFDLEKRPDDLAWLPLRYALPNYELFASIDDNHKCPGYSLQARGLYPRREVRAQIKTNKEDSLKASSRVSSKVWQLTMSLVPKRTRYYLRKFRWGVTMTLRGL